MKSKVTRIAIFNFQDRRDVDVTRNPEFTRSYRNITKSTMGRLSRLSYQKTTKTRFISGYNRVDLYIRPI